ncbi:MAG: hypothetical protein H6608_04890 [Flavobacteriales bacterium]|nr:hypothetical protein [Bacteroidota bacterium]MCB9240440.1 hypothetical protein [Flavobacteriales bacterium]
MKEYITELHAKYNIWIKELEFYRDELKTFNNRLGDIVSQNTKTEITSQVEHFQNQFIRENEVIDILQHDIREEEHKLAENAMENNVATDHRKVEEDTELNDRMDTFKKIYGDLKNEFNKFLTETY